MGTQFTPFMCNPEYRFKMATGLPNRSHYKIFYGQIRPAWILTLGINPGGDHKETLENGCKHSDGRKASASSSYFEGDEHDVLDCEWRENVSLRKLLTPLLGGDRERIRNEVVKSNLAFRRSEKVSQINREQAFDEAEPFLSEIIAKVEPKLVLLTGPTVREFAGRFASENRVLVEPEKDCDIHQTIFAASSVRLRSSVSEALLVQVAHASQFGWTYEKLDIPSKIIAMMVSHCQWFPRP